MSASEYPEGFIVHAWSRTHRGRTTLYLLGRLSDGRTFAVIEERYRPSLFVRAADFESARRLLGEGVTEWKEAELATMDGAACRQALFATVEDRKWARETLAAAGVRTYEADLRVADQFRLERGIRGSVRIAGPSRPGRHVGLVFTDSELSASDWVPRLSVLSIDIETDVTSGAILAIGLCLRDPYGQDRDEVLYAGGLLQPEQASDPAVRVYASEEHMLAAFSGRLREMDPDVLTGWNVVDFDLRALAERFRRYRLPFRLGRSEEEAVWLPANDGRASRAILPGRQAWDALRIARAAPERYEDYSLETVAEAVLGYGKRIEVREGEERLDALVRLHREDPQEFCLYCLQDARLVQEILERTGLLELTLRRCQLIGVAPDLAWTSIPAFEHLYIEAMHRRGVVAPTAGVDALPMDGAPGGGILTPRPGLYDRVFLFDFQSLYPSIIRTFNIDPLSYVRPGTTTGGGDFIEAPNGARFRREPAILPELLDRFFDSRRQARERGDAVASYVYKIIMNSFYGVLGASGCRFAGSEIAGAVTSFGQHILGWCRDYLEARGRRVLYGDTDSLFVLAPGETGEAIAAEVNRALTAYLAERWRVAPRLLLEYEKEYERFFLPPMRGEEPASEEEAPEHGQPARGRAKNYAGLIARGPDGPAAIGDRIEIKGMEAVRRDWTGLARDFQMRLLEMLFGREELPAFREHIARLVRELRAGRLDDRLVYRKALRKPVEQYTRSTPPHVKAALLLPPGERRGLIRYVMTIEGPRPVGRLGAPIDYTHYIEKQLKPIAAGFAEVLQTSTEALFGGERQLDLF